MDEMKEKMDEPYPPIYCNSYCCCCPCLSAWLCCEYSLKTILLGLCCIVPTKVDVESN